MPTARPAPSRAPATTDAGRRPRRDLSATIASHSWKKHTMKNLIAPLSFTLAAAWVVVLFVLVHSNP